MIREAYWGIELLKEAPDERILGLLEKIYPRASKIENVRKQRISGVDWKIYLPNGEILKIDDKTDNWLGFTGNISLDQMTTINKEVLQLFVNPAFPGKFLLLDNNKISAETLLLYGKPHKMSTNGHETLTYIIAIRHIEKAIIKAEPSIKFFKIARARGQVLNQSHKINVSTYDEFKNAIDHSPRIKDKKQADKIGNYDDDPCPLSTEGFCKIAKEQGREFYCGSNWWNSCTIYTRARAQIVY